jgi:hypothetical protein
MHRRRAKCYIPDLLALDIHKERNSIAAAESGRSRPVEYLGEIANEPGAIGKLCDRLGRPAGKRLAFCYEAGPCGYGVHRQLTAWGSVMSGRRPLIKGYFWHCAGRRCGHVFGLLRGE